MTNSRTPSALAVEIDGVPPICRLNAGRRTFRKQCKKIADRAEMVVDDVENHSHADAHGRGPPSAEFIGPPGYSRVGAKKHTTS